jgi:hypothetical protein
MTDKIMMVTGLDIDTGYHIHMYQEFLHSTVLLQNILKII